MRAHKRILTRTELIWGVPLIFLLLLGCQFKSNLSTPTNEPQADPVSLQPDTKVMNLTAGLNALSSYQVSYTKIVQGVLDGSPYETSTHITRSLVSGQPGEESIVDSLGSDGIRMYFHYIRLGDQHYYQTDPDGSCKGSVDSAPSGMIGEPAAMLPAVLDPKPAGKEVVNGIETSRYQLDGAALRISPEAATVTGSLWIADQGGYVVKYSLLYEPLAADQGNGLKASQSIEYEISRVNQIQKIALPASCIPVLTDLPVMPDAADVDRRSALMSYTTNAARPEVIDFYARELPTLGWQLEVMDEGDPGAGLSYSKDGSLLNILLEPTDNGLLVSVMLSDPAFMTPLEMEEISDSELLEGDSGLDTASPTVLAPTVDAQSLGLPEDVPLYPGATQILSTSGMGISFLTSDPPEMVIQFYTEALSQSGWESASIPGQSGERMIWIKGEIMLTITLLPVGDGNTNVSIMAVQG